RSLLFRTKWMLRRFRAGDHVVDGWLAGKRSLDRFLGRLVVVVVDLLVVSRVPVNEDADQNAVIVRLVAWDHAALDRVNHRARDPAAGVGPTICTACLAPLRVTLLKRSVAGFAGRFGATTASSVVNPSLLFVGAWQNAAPAGPVFEPMIRSI